MRRFNLASAHVLGQKRDIARARIDSMLPVAVRRIMSRFGIASLSGEGASGQVKRNMEDRFDAPVFCPVAIAAWCECAPGSARACALRPGQNAPGQPDAIGHAGRKRRPVAAKWF
jgi:hypothetical protein